MANKPNNKYETVQLTAGMLQSIQDVLFKFWMPPNAMEEEVKKVLSLYETNQHADVRVSGETSNLTVYIINPKTVFVFTPFAPVRENILVKELFGDLNLPEQTKQLTLERCADFDKRLKFPIVLLANPCVIDNFPIPRLSLSIGLLAGYLRRAQKADVRIIDMQMGYTINDVVQLALEIKPDLFGMSVSYGQKEIALSILKDIYEGKRANILNPLVVLGNIIPASFPKEFIDLYPDLVVARNEGESTISGLVDYLLGLLPLSQVPGLVYGEHGRLRMTGDEPLDVRQIPLPAMDTVPELAKARGALTLELSRGCQWGVCTFCPREHKSSLWKTFSAGQIIEQFSYLDVLCDEFGLKKHVFLADEEFVGGMNNGLETARIKDMAKGLMAKGLRFRYDAAARVDQVFTPRMDYNWHIGRVEMWHLTRKAGLDRLFMGLESGSEAQLQRYGKGIKPEHSIYAIRLLSALGIPLRFGFITYDQLMIGLTDLRANVQFLQRTDAFLRPVDVTEIGYERLFNLIQYDTDFIKEHAVGKPIYAGVSYMLASMEVLINSRYRLLLKQAEKRYGKKLLLDEDAPDTNMGRYRVDFVDDMVRDLSVFSQRWIDRHFGLAYAVKSLYKVASETERRYLMSWLIKHRWISQQLVKGFLYLFEPSPDEMMLDEVSKNLKESVRSLRRDADQFGPRLRPEVILECMTLYDDLILQENALLQKLLSEGSVVDSTDRQLQKAIEFWYNRRGSWDLINDSSRTGHKPDPKSKSSVLNASA